MNDRTKIEMKLAQSISYADARSRSPKVPRLAEHVDRALKDDDVWKACQPYLFGISRTGSTQFNHANIVRELRAWDAEHNGGIINASGLSDVAIWHVAERQVRKAFVMNRGIIVGLLEQQAQLETENAIYGKSDDDEGGDLTV